MKIMIEFYRTRDKNDAHAIIGRVMDDAIDREDAIKVARSLALTFSMPQRPDGMTITDTAGQELYAGIFDTIDRRKDATVMRSNIQRGWENNAIGVWENEGGASGTDSANHQYGRRVEMDRSWTVYNVFSGAPANTSGNSMTGLSQLDATDGMLSLNLRSERRQKARDKPLTRKAKDH